MSGTVQLCRPSQHDAASVQQTCKHVVFFMARFFMSRWIFCRNKGARCCMYRRLQGYMVDCATARRNALRA